MNTLKTPEMFALGEVLSEECLAPEEFGLTGSLEPQSLRKLTVLDPYLPLVPEERFDRVRREEELLDQMCREARETGEWERRPGLTYEFTDEEGEVRSGRTSGYPLALNQFYGDKSTVFQQWGRSSIPSAYALAALSHPLVGQRVLDKSGEPIGLLDETASDWFTCCHDGLAIRTRATALAEIVTELLKHNQELGTGPWASIACGTAIPTLQVARSNQVKPPLTLVDADRGVLDGVTEMANELRIGNGFDKQVGNVFGEEFMQKELPQHLLDKWGGKLKLIEAMGIWEYIGEQLQQLGITTTPEEFLGWNMDLLEPGGSFIFGQMLTGRPVGDFTLGAVGWPFIVTRSLREIMQITKNCGIPSQNVDIVIPNPGVYAVVAIKK